MPVANLFHASEPPAQGERFDTLLSHRNLQIERILSSSRIESVDYVQEQDEWVLLARGEARMTVAGEALELTAGDHLFLPAGTPHRVERTSDGALWLAIHLHPGNGV
ncbi:cupin domain-containing protein [Pseudomonas sp. G34]|jgi:cupin 2 domain-containing protein|uniref:cupin domain-containing protein n=1 Tax=Pseudomonas sp. G34 TaxID=3059083 RepID=UPI002808E926|nr:cupin domain-containing protein [Pseudomonas sp. G34]MDQ7984857.1 cupin domain-containing protein [Pseudomonas sp. G34]